MKIITGFYYLQSRYYSPSWSRFLNRDEHFDTHTGVLGTNMYLYCNNNPVTSIDPSGQWAVEPLVNGKIYYIKENHKGHYLDVTKSGDSGTQVIAWTKNSNKNQQWKAIKISNGIYEFAPMHNTGLRLDVCKGKDSEGATVLAYKSNGGKNQRWAVYKTGTGVCTLIPESSQKGLCLDIDGGANVKTNGNAILFSWHGAGNQKFTFEPVVTGISISATTKTLTEGDTTVLTAKLTPSDVTVKDVTWSSSNTSVATVGLSYVSIPPGGYVSAKKAGTATITATTKDQGKKATCLITVKANTTIQPSSVQVKPTTLTVEVKKTQKLTATVSPSNATNKTVTWSSSNTSIATVDGSGVVTGVKAGTATITVKTKDGGKTATCKVTVKPLNSNLWTTGYTSDNHIDKYAKMGWQYPVVPSGYARVTAGFRDEYYLQDFKQIHAGIDLGKKSDGTAINGAELRAIASGTVIVVDNGSSPRGKHIAIRTENKDPVSGEKLIYSYFHMSEIYASIKEGKTITAGTVVGKVGGTPNYDPHLHFQVSTNGQYNPDNDNRKDNYVNPIYFYPNTIFKYDYGNNKDFRDLDENGKVRPK